MVMRSTSALLERGGRGGSRMGVVAVVGEKNLLEARFVAGEIDDLARGDRAQERCKGAVHRAAHPLAVLFDVVDSIGGADRLDRWCCREVDLDLMDADFVQLGQARR